MSLKTYRYPEVQEFMKPGGGVLLFALQYAPTYKLEAIYDAFPGLSTANPTSLIAVKIDTNRNEISRTSLATTLIVYDSTTDQYLIDSSKILSTLFDESIYFLEFQNGTDLFKTDAFLVKVMNYEILASNRIILASSSILNNQATINI